MLKKWKKSVLAIMVFWAVLGSGLLIQANSFGRSEKKVENTAPAYYCPMHPNYVSDKPGDCPICHMRLVPVENEGQGMKDEGRVVEDPSAVCIMHDCPMMKDGQPCPMLVIAEKGEKVECPVCKSKLETTSDQKVAPIETGYASILISQEKQQLIGIKTSMVERKKVEKVIRAVGRIAYDPELYEAESEYIQSYKTWTESQTAGSQARGADWAMKLVESAKTKLTRMGLSEEMIASLQHEEGPDKSLLYATAGGQAWVYANIYEYEAPVVKVGDRLVVEASSSPGLKIEGLIRAIDTVVDTATRSVRVRAQVSNPEGLLKPDMYVNVALNVDLGEVMTVPEEAVFFTGKANIVFVDRGSGLFEPRSIVVGQRTEGLFEVKDGLSEGERVITNGNFLVDSESRLKAALSGMTGHSHGG